MIAHPLEAQSPTQLNNNTQTDTASVDSNGEIRTLIRPVDLRQGDVISSHRAVLTLSKSMFNAGCFSLPYAWMLAGKWVAFVLTFVIAGFNWYGNHILVRSSQHLAKKTGVASLDYGHFAKRVCDRSEVPFLRQHSKRIMLFFYVILYFKKEFRYIVNITILFYQLGMCAVSILFISENMVHLLGRTLGRSQTLMATIATIFIMFTNMFTEIRVISMFAMISSIFFLLGAGVVMQYTLQQPSQWNQLPAYTNFTNTIVFIGMSMYAFEGQTMILPIENKLANPNDFLDNFGVLPTTMCLCTIFMTAIGFYGYNGFGQQISETITVNVPQTGLYSVVNAFLCIQSILGHSIAMYVVFDMFYRGFRRKFIARFPNVPNIFVDKGFRFFWVFITYLMAVLIPRLAVMIPLVGVTSGTLCALVYPPFFQIITDWSEWKLVYSPTKRILRISINCFVIILGFFAIGAGILANIIQLMNPPVA